MVYKTKGVCSQSIDVEVENGIVKHVQFTGGCNGNTQGVSRLIEGMDAKELMPKVLAKNVAYVPGGPFYPHGGNANHFRLNYSNMPEERIVEGIKRLAEVLKEELAK